MRYHITSTHAEKEAFQCDIKSDGIQCIYYATTNSNLRAHKKRVHDEKPTNANLAKHVCGLCDFRTNTKFNLDRHSEKCKTLDPSPNFITKWKVLEDCFGIGCTLKIHIIDTHLLEVLRDTGKTLHDESDEPVEQAHYKTKAFEVRHGYHISDRKMMTPNAGRRQQSMMEHLNSYHLR